MEIPQKKTGQYCRRQKKVSNKDEESETQNLYLEHLYIKKDYKDTQTDLVESGKFESEYPLPANVSNVSMQARLSEYAPEGTKTVLSYMKNGTTPAQRNMDTANTRLWYPVSIGTGMETSEITVVTGAGEDTQTYTVRILRSMVLGDATFTLEDSSAPVQVENTYYLPMDYKGSVQIKADGYGSDVALQMNGKTIEAEADGSGWKVTPEFQEDGSCQIHVEASYGEGEEKQTIQKDYVLRCLSRNRAGQWNMWGECDLVLFERNPHHQWYRNNARYWLQGYAWLGSFFK